MNHNFEKILENVLEARDNNLGLSMLLEKYPEEKGAYTDAWRFVEELTDEMKTIGSPSKNGLEKILLTINNESIRSPWVTTKILVPVGIIAVTVAIGSLHGISSINKKPTAIPTAQIQEQQIAQPNQVAVLNEQPIQQDTSALSDTLSSINTTYQTDYAYQTTTDISLADTQQFTDITTSVYGQ